MTLLEDYIWTYKEEGVDEAISTGRVITKEDYQAGRVNDAIRFVDFLVSQGLSLDKGLEAVNEDIREPVREAILKRDQQS